MQRLIVFLAVIGMCIGCSGSQGSAPDYEVRNERDENVPNLKVKTVEVYTESIKEKQLRRIAADIKRENTDQDAIDITFYTDKQGESKGQSDQQETGTAIVVNNEAAANQMLRWPLFTGADREKILNEENGIVVISWAEMEQELEQESRELEKEMEKETRETEQEMKEAEEKMNQELEEMEREMEKEMQELPKP